jgi:hypothetical protein
VDGDATRGWTSGRQAIGELWIVDVASGKTRRLREGDGLDPTWSPNGRFVAYWGMSTGAVDPRRWRDIWVIPAAGGTPVAITHDAPVDWTTSPSDAAGTIAYLAPERFQGKPATVQSDLYALGLILYETYTGKRAFSGATIGEWQRAHTDSTPTSPSALVTEIEPAVERAIMRCLEKDPAKRPASAAHVAAALPGGDPLAAALAAGETPSPELVAASGEEGTLPRAKAWLWLATCLTALVLAVPLGSLWHLSNLVPSRDPLLQTTEAQQILRDIGYTGVPADSAWWFRTDDAYMRRLLQMTPARARFAPASTPAQGALIFCYRQSSKALFSLSPMGGVDALDPPPVREDDAFVELNPSGGLRTLLVGGLGFGSVRPTRAGSPPWARLFAAAGLDIGLFSEVTPKWTPIFAFDTRVAWEGRQGEEPLRVEAAAFRGWPVHFRVLPASAVPSPPGRRGGVRLEWLFDLSMALLFAAPIVGLAALARRNTRMGRGDRKGARRLALAVFALQSAVLILSRHWTLVPMQSLIVVFYFFGLAFSLAIVAWMYYLGFEPYVRRRWPHLLIAWSRLVEGRWRDPLVGRCLLAGTTLALCVAAILPGLAVAATRTFDLPIAVPWGQSQLGPFPSSLAAFFADRITSFVGIVTALFALVMLLAARLIVRHDRTAWAVLVVTFVVIVSWTVLLVQPYAMTAPLGIIVFAGVLSIATAVVLARHGLLGCSVFAIVGTALLNTPLTADLTRWYAWRTLVLAALVVGLAVWGFRNVLGRQSPFPAGTLDE